jgi:hypothetical protein
VFGSPAPDARSNCTAVSCPPVGIQQRTTAAGHVRYEVRLRGPDGQERSRTFRTRKAAETYERELLAQRDRGGWVDPRAGRITLAEWVSEWSATLVNLRPSSQRIYLDNLRLHVLPKLGSVQLNKLDKAMLRAWLARLSAGPLKPATVHQVYRALRRTLASAVENDIIVRNPLEGIKPPRVESQEMRFLTAVEVATLADTIDERYGPSSWSARTAVSASARWLACVDTASTCYTAESRSSSSSDGTLTGDGRCSR